MTHRVTTIVFAVLIAIVAGLLFVFDPTHLGVLPPCPLHRLTGLWCPGCGSTRALYQLVHGNLMAALRFNPLAISLLPLVGYLSIRGERVVIKAVWIWALLGIVITFGILRNIPAYPFTLLTP
jgi:Protein of unknown function (DUF2752)